MADSGFPNRNRADNALTIYRDAMRRYIAPALERKHGRNWFRSQVLTDDARERNPGSYARRQQSLKRGAPAQNLIDLADFPFLVQENRDAFPDLDQSDTRRMHMVRELRNEIHHPDRTGDCAPEEAASIAGLCALVVERCGLSDAVESIRRLSAGEPASALVDAESVSRKERERREWDKERLAGKPTHKLTPWEQQRLAEIEWEEEWERRERDRVERERQEREREQAERAAALAQQREQEAQGGHEERKQARELAVAGDAGYWNALGLRTDGTAVHWARKQLLGPFIAVSAGDQHSIALRDDGTVLCWGDNEGGQCDAPPGPFVAVSAGGHHSIALRNDSTMVCWGDNDFGRCDAPSGRFVAVSAGQFHSIALRDDGTVLCWGDNENGQCGAPLSIREVAAKRG